MTHAAESAEKLSKNSSGFVKDENGQLHIVPMKIPPFLCASTKKSGEKMTSTRCKYIPLKPLKFTSADFQDSPQQLRKKPRLECPTRKELFQVPQKKANARLSRYGSRSSLSTKRTSSVQKTKITKKAISDKSPLIDAEKLLNPSQSAKTVLFRFSPKKFENVVSNTPKKVPLATIDETPSTNESAMSEFLRLEQALASAKKPVINFSSPMTSVCNLLKNTKIENSAKKNKDEKGILNDILTSLKEDMEEFESLKEHFSKYQIQHEKRIKNITTLIRENFEDKENNVPSRRSIRIASQADKTKFVTSPAISEKIDLRKKALNQNLSKNFHCESPRTKSAMTMYNTFRGDCSVLCTPKLDRTNTEVTQSSATRSLSRRIQKQCLLLQDTPKA